MIKHRKKDYVENGIYHVYNRGVNGDTIFLTETDYKVFTHLLSLYLLPKTPLNFDKNRNRKNYSESIELYSFCLMPNHFHLVLRQKELKSIAEFCHSLFTAYSLTTNRRNKRFGHLFQDIYKARLIVNEEDLVNTINYVHNNPIDIGIKPEEYDYSSIASYKNLRTTKYDFVLPYRVELWRELNSIS